MFAVESFGIRKEPNIKIATAKVRAIANKVKEMQDKINQGYSQIL